MRKETPWHTIPAIFLGGQAEANETPQLQRAPRFRHDPVRFLPRKNLIVTPIDSGKARNWGYYYTWYNHRTQLSECSPYFGTKEEADDHSNTTIHYA
jgi:hypothetical protein